MAFRELAYQERALTALETYLDALKPEKERYDRAAALIADDPDLGIELPHFPARAWEALKSWPDESGSPKNWLPTSRVNTAYSPRMSGDGQPVPNATLKVPTGGGNPHSPSKSLISLS